MSAPGRAPLREFARRRTPRCPLAVPVRVTVLRSGTAYSIPGRSLDLGEGGIAVILAGEVHPTDSVGVEFLLPELGLGLQAKAVVRHYAPLRCGFEFQGLTRYQQAVVREWTRQILQGKGSPTPTVAPEPVEPTPTAPVREQPARFTLRYRRLLKVVGAVLVLSALLAWWHWQRGWKELERQIPRTTGRLAWPMPEHLAGVADSILPGSARANL
jgi:PilZ domain